MTTALVELRVLEGPNLYFPRAAIKLTLDLSALIDAPDERVRRLAARIGLTRVRPGAPGSGFRQRFAARAVARLVRQVAVESGTTRLAVRVRPTHDVHQVVVAYPWRHRGRGQALGRAVAEVLDGLAAPAAEDRGPDLDALVATAARSVGAADPGGGRPRSARGSRWSRSPAPTARPPPRG
ncbi:hypothetical protein [Nocardioides mesophilus]|uniref:hypothetical protein n=1 Tax=Nocardioides mesophilus TaxID=433659 RepID=UPI001FE532CC|nr:hypothetical protein [Nocardioides mesophilus]